MTTNHQAVRSSDRLHLAVALDGAGWHPHAWRDAGLRPADFFGPDYWISLAHTAERGLLDFLTIEDTLSLQTALPVAAAELTALDARTDQFRGRLDAVQVASFLGPETSRIGLVATTNVTQTEPFHLATQLATLDYTSRGRAGWRVQVDRAGESENFGRRESPDFTLETLSTPEGQAFIASRFDEAADVVEVARRLWDSWEDDAVIRDAATGRFLDREKLHYADFVGAHFSVKGPSITPRPPQGQPLVTVLAHAPIPYRLAARAADIVYITPQDDVHLQTILGELDEATRTAGRTQPLGVFADLVVAIEETDAAAERRRISWDEKGSTSYTSDARIVAASVHTLAELLQNWHANGVDGFRLRPVSHARDLPAIAEALVPELQSRGVFRRSYDTDTLRGHLGLGRPANRYAA